jgi:peptidoglycan/LPS O-acetylase OafA/YrhL
LAGDALRAYALMAVVVFHIAAGVLLLDTGTYDFEAAYGSVAGSLIQGLQTSVYVFFALSAFLLSRPFVRSAMSGTRFPSVRRYARHRVGRIVPGFWVAVVVVLVAYGVQGSGIGQVLALMGFAQVYHHGQVAALVDHAWSLDVEMLFYALLVPLAAASRWLIRRHRRGGILAVALILAACALGAALQHAGLDDVTPVSQSPLGNLRSFLPGILLAVLAVRWPAYASWQRVPRWTAPLLLTVGLVLLWRTPFWAPEGNNLRLVIGTLSGGCILAAVVVRQFTGGAVWRLFRGAAVAWVGERSYSIFLMHGTVFWALHDVGDGQPTTARRLVVVLAVAIPAIFLAAQALHVLVERPMMQLSRRPRPGDRRPEPVPEPVPALAPAGAPV